MDLRVFRDCKGAFYRAGRALLKPLLWIMEEAPIIFFYLVRAQTSLLKFCFVRKQLGDLR